MQALLFSSYPDETAVLMMVLQQAGFVVSKMKEIDKIISMGPQEPVDLLVLIMTDENTQMHRQIKSLRGVTIAPIVVIFDSIPESMQVHLLDAGADLLLPRPYSVRIFLAQLRTLLRRSNSVSAFSLPPIERDGIMLDLATRVVKVRGSSNTNRLTQLEFRLLYTLMIRAGQIIPTENIVEYVWGYSGVGNRELVRGLVQRLRAKIELNPSEPKFILNDPGTGYFFAG